MDIKKFTKKQKLWAAAIAILLILGIVFYLNYQDRYVGERATSKNETKEEIVKREENKADKSLLVVFLNQKIVFETSNSKGILNIENLPENNYDITVELIMGDKKEVTIYESGKIKPGYMIKEAKLDKKIDKGHYSCIARVTGYDDEGTPVKSVDMQVDLTIYR